MSLPYRVTSDMMIDGSGSSGSGTLSNEAKIEQQQKFIIQLQGLITSLQKTIEELNKKLENFEGKASASEKPRTTDVKPIVMEGWSEVKKTRKKGPPRRNEQETQERDKKDQSSTENLSKYLVLDDWDVPLVSAEELCMKDKGFTFVPQRTGEELFEEIGGRMLSAPKGALAIVTPKQISAAANKCREIKVRIKKNSGAVEFITRWITNLGDTIVKPCNEKKAAINAATLNVKNETSRIVVMFVKKHMNVKDYEAAKIAPDVPFDLWLKKCSMEKVLYRSRPSVKVIGEDEWLEVIITVSNPVVNRLLQSSGRDGVFTKIFKTKDSLEEPLSRVVWLGIEATLSDAIEKAKPVESRTLGLEVGRRSLGIRVPTDYFKEVLPVILPKTLADAELKKQDQKIYEISKAPPWIAFEQLQESFKGLWAWEIELVRVMNRFGSKTFLVRASKPPPREAAIVDKQWMPIRLAPERPRQEVQRLFFTKKVNPTPAAPSTVVWSEARRTSISKGEKQPGTGSGQQATFTSSASDLGGSLESTMRQFMREMASGLNDLKTRMATVEAKCEAAVEFNMETDEELSDLSEIDTAKPRKKIKRKVLKY